MQTAIRNMAPAYPGMVDGLHHEAHSLVNDAGSVRQIDDLTVTAAADATYSFSVDVGNGPITVSYVGTAAEGVASIRNGLVDAARAIQAFEGLVAFNRLGSGGVLRIESMIQGRPFTSAESDTNITRALTQANAVTVNIPFGYGVVFNGGADGRSARLPSSGTDVFAGVVRRAHTTVDPNLANPDDRVGKTSPFQNMSVVYSGRIWVPVDEAVAVGDAAFLRHTANGSIPGVFRTDADTSNAFAINGKFVSAGVANGLAILQLAG